MWEYAVSCAFYISKYTNFKYKNDAVEVRAYKYNRGVISVTLSFIVNIGYLKI
jgi:hypothetical protein